MLGFIALFSALGALGFYLFSLYLLEKANDTEKKGWQAALFLLARSSILIAAACLMAFLFILFYTIFTR